MTRRRATCVRDLFDQTVPVDGRVCGVDEAGRGPLAGPVFAAAVILDPDCRIDGLADSKLLSPARREELARQIRDRSMAWAVAEATAKEEGKPEAAMPKIVEGRVNAFFKDNCLLEQPSVVDSKKNVAQVLAESGTTVTGFARFEPGQA